MRVGSFILPMWAALVAVLALGPAAQAALLIKIDKTSQRMSVSVNGVQLYDWAVSTGARGYDTPSGSFKPFRMDIDHHSDEWDNAPMPYSIFFTKTGNAVHGTSEQRHLGQAMSHGCVRLSVKNASILWKLVKKEKMANTTVVVTGAFRGAKAPAMAQSHPLSLAADGLGDEAPPRQIYQRRSEMPSPAYQRRYDDEPRMLPFPLFLFGR